MSKLDTRNVSRDSLFLMAEMRSEGESAAHRIRVRNLSDGGLMAEGEGEWQLGALASVTLRNIGEVEGTIAWVQGNRCGIAFVEEIDSRQVRSLGHKREPELQRFVAPPPPQAKAPPKPRSIKI